jgi:putative oxidoreductase
MAHNLRHKEETTMANPTFPLVARILIGALFVTAGIRKAMTIAMTAGYLTKLGFPGGEMAAYLAVLIEIGGGVLLIIGWQARLMAWLLTLFTLVATFAAHRFWEFDAAQYNNQLNHFLKNLAIVGGLLMLASHGPGMASVDKR